MYPMNMGPPVPSGTMDVSVNDFKLNEASPLFYSQAFIRQYMAFNERMRGFYRGVIATDVWAQNGCANTATREPALRALRNGNNPMENGSNSNSFSYRRDLPSAYFANFCAPR